EQLAQQRIGPGVSVIHEVAGRHHRVGGLREAADRGDGGRERGGRIDVTRAGDARPLEMHVADLYDGDRSLRHGVGGARFQAACRCAPSLARVSRPCKRAGRSTPRADPAGPGDPGLDPHGTPGRPGPMLEYDPTAPHVPRLPRRGRMIGKEWFERWRALADARPALARLGRDLALDVCLRVDATPWFMRIEAGRIVAVDAGPFHMRRAHLVLAAPARHWAE